MPRQKVADQEKAGSIKLTPLEGSKTMISLMVEQGYRVPTLEEFYTQFKSKATGLENFFSPRTEVYLWVKVGDDHEIVSVTYDLRQEGWILKMSATESLHFKRTAHVAMIKDDAADARRP